MERNTVLLRETEAFMRGELDNVTVSQNSIVLDLVQGSYVPYGCYTSAPISMPVFDALRVSWNAASPRGTAVEAQARVLVDGNWTPWVGFGKWSPYLHRESPTYQERGPVQRWPAHLQLDSKYATQAQLRIYLYSKDEKATPAVTLLGVSTHVVDVIPARGRPVNARLHLMPYAAARRTPALRPWMDLANCLASLTNRWGADLLPEEFAQVLRDWRAPDDCDPRNLSFAAAAAALTKPAIIEPSPIYFTPFPVRPSRCRITASCQRTLRLGTVHNAGVCRRLPRLGSIRMRLLVGLFRLIAFFMCRKFLVCHLGFLLLCRGFCVELLHFRPRELYSRTIRAVYVLVP